MSVKIHHGPHGSYKTSGAVHDDLIPAIKEGRPIVTNLRGITLDRIYDAIPDAPANLELHVINTGTHEGLLKMQRFFHWCPPNSFLFIDEAQIVFPKSWRDSDLKALDFPGGFDEAVKQGRPPTWHHAWDMERHFNFDVILTTPSIKKIRDDIRQNAEGAFKHKNNAIYGAFFRGSYIEGFHFADDNGTAASDFQSIVRKRIKPDDPTWKLYDSTSTGQHRDTKAGINLLASPRLLVPLGVLAIAIAFIASRPLPAVIAGKPDAPPPVAPSQSVPAVPFPARPAQAMPVAASAVAAGEGVVNEKSHPFEGQPFRYLGSIDGKGKKRGYFEVAGIFMTSDELAELEYHFQYLTECAVAVHHGANHFLVTCESPASSEPPENDREAIVAGPSPVSNPAGAI